MNDQSKKRKTKKELEEEQRQREIDEAVKLAEEINKPKITEVGVHTAVNVAGTLITFTAKSTANNDNMEEVQTKLFQRVLDHLNKTVGAL